jgi:hypothetical protein
VYLFAADLLPHLAFVSHICLLSSTLQDILTDDEIISDVYDLKEVDGVVYEANCANIKIGGESFDTGGNASAEGGDDETVEDGVETKIDVVYSFRLQSTGFDKKGYLTYLKGYMKAVKEKLKSQGVSDEEVKKFESGA